MRRSVGDHAPVGDEHAAGRAAGSELGVVGGDDDRLAGARAGGQIGGERGLRLTVHPTGRLIEREHGGARALAGPAVAADDREGQTLALAPGKVARVAVGEPRETGTGEHRRGCLVADTLVEQIVAGVLKEEGDAPGALDPPAGRLEQPGGVTQEGRLAGAVATHQGDALTGLHRELHAAQNRRPGGQLMPDAVQGERGRRPARTAHAGHPARARSRRRLERARPSAAGPGDALAALDTLPTEPLGGRVTATGNLEARSLETGTVETSTLGTGTLEASSLEIGALDSTASTVPVGEQATAAELGARVSHADGRRLKPGEREHLCAGRLQRGGTLGGPPQKGGGIAVVGDFAALHRNHAVGDRQAALEAVLGQQDRHLPLLVQTAEQADQLVAGDGVELRGGLVEEDHGRASGKRGGESHALLLTA